MILWQGWKSMGPTDPEVHMLVFNKNLSLQFASTTLVLSSQILMVETLERNHLEQNHVFVWESVVSNRSCFQCPKWDLGNQTRWFPIKFWLISLPISLSSYLSFYMSILLPMYLLFCLLMCMSSYLSICLLYVYDLSLHLFLCLSIRLSISLSFYLSVYASICRSIFPPICISVHQSVYDLSFFLQRQTKRVYEASSRI